MATSWPEHTFTDKNFKDVSELAQVFELHCAKVYDHAANHPDHAASADYVRQLVSQAYRAVHSLHMQSMASSCLDMEIAAETLENKAIEYRRSRELLPAHEPSKVETAIETTSGKDNAGTGLKGLLTGDYEEDEEEDSDWEESEEETDDEYYEYCEGSDAESETDEQERELEVIVESPNSQSTLRIREPKMTENITHTAPDVNDTSENHEREWEQKHMAQYESPSPSPPPVSIIQDQEMHDRITAALRTLPLPCHESELEEIPLARVVTHVDRPMAYSTESPTDDERSEATAVQTESNQETQCTTSVTATATVPAGDMARKPSFDATRLHRKLSRSSPAGLPRRLKTVCYKYVRRAMVPIRGQAH